MEIISLNEVRQSDSVKIEDIRIVNESFKEYFKSVRDKAKADLCKGKDASEFKPLFDLLVDKLFHQIEEAHELVYNV